MTKQTLAVFVFLLFFGALPASAQTEPVLVSEVYATTNIQNATTTARSGNTITLSFDLSNREGVQPGVRYGVALVRMNNGVATLFDEHVYDETLTLGVGESVHRSVTYAAPEHLSGTYSLLLSAKSTSGVPFAAALAGSVTLQARKDIVYIDPASCFITISADKTGTRYTLLEKATVSTLDKKVLAHCTVKNGTGGEVTLAPQVVQRLRSAYGDAVSGAQAPAAQVIVAPQSSKQIVVEVPPVTAPQTYYVALSLKDAGTGKETNTVAFRYVVQGAGASFQTLLLDKDAYSAGETAVVSFMWSPLVDTVSKGTYAVSKPLASAVATFSITNGAGAACGAPATYLLTSNDRLVRVPIPITADCRNPKVSADITDSAYGTLDAQSFSVASRTAGSQFLTSIMNFFTNIYVIAGILVLLLIAGAIMCNRRNITTPVVLLLLGFGLFGGAQSALADSAALYYECFPGSPCPGATTIWASGSLDKSSYIPGEPMYFTAWMTSDDNPIGVYPSAQATITGLANSGDIFPRQYSQTELQIGIQAKVLLANAPSSSGFVNTLYWADGYNSVAGSIPFTIIATPTVNIFFE